MKTLHSWKWMAWGKHPAVSDFLQIGEQHPVGKALAEWVSNGYRRLSLKEGRKGNGNSWRFWVHAGQKQILSSGICRDSSDAIGRHFPFLVIGTGRLEQWEKHWDMLPLALENCWNRSEYLSAGRFGDFGELEETVRKLPSPHMSWIGIEEKRNFVLTATSEDPDRRRTLEKLAASVEGNTRRPMGILDLAEGSTDDPSDLLLYCHLLLKNAGAERPFAVFIGGRPEKIMLAIFRRPLRPDDFARLWSSEIKPN